MATTRVSKIKHRQGNFADLPILDPGELGYIKMSEKINNSEAIGFKELMRMKIYGT